MTNLRLVASLVLAGAAVGCAGEDRTVDRLQPDLTVCADGPTLDGIDVSYYQGNIDWGAVAAGGITFAFIRVSDGTGFLDPKFDQNWAGAQSAGVIRGVYQFFRPSDDPIAQADLLLEHMGPLAPGDLPPVLDVEATDGESAASITAKIHLWVDHVAAATGRTPIIYTGKYFWNDNVGSTDFADAPLWIAQYGPTCPDLPSAWSAWKFFQTSSTGSIPGIAGNVDTNLFNGDLAGLMAFANATPVCGDGWCSGGETNDACPGDCPVCEGIPALGRVIDENEVCFEGGGTPSALRTEQAGYGGSLVWTHTTDWPMVDNFGRWHLDFLEGGNYRVEVFTPAPWAQSRLAVYQIQHAGELDTAPLDQAATDGWQVLGDYAFAAGGEQWLRVDDNTGEALAGNVQIVFDAVRVTRLDPPGDPAGVEPVAVCESCVGAGGDGEDGAVENGCAVGGHHGGPPGHHGRGAALLVALFAVMLFRSRRANLTD